MHAKRHSSWIRAHGDVLSILLTLLLATLVALFALDAFQAAEVNKTDHKTRLALAVGALGGLTHELLQSRGKLLFFRRMRDGIQVGSLSSLIVGAVAGLLAVEALLAPTSYETALPREIAWQAFMAGLALKGLAEATGNTAHAHATHKLAESTKPAHRKARKATGTATKIAKTVTH